VSMPDAITHFSNSVGLTITCIGNGTPPLEYSWLSESGEETVPIQGIR